MHEVSAEDGAQHTRDRNNGTEGRAARCRLARLRVGGLVLSCGLSGTEIDTRELLLTFILGDYNPE